MGNWKQRVTGWPSHRTEIEQNFLTLFLAACQSRDLALFRRCSPDRRHAYWLLSPRAAFFSSLLQGCWDDTEPTVYQWDLVVGAPGAAKRLGLETSLRPMLTILRSLQADG